MGTTKDTKGDWRSVKRLITDSASVCQPEPEKGKRLDHASTSEHICSFDWKLYCVSSRVQAQYHITRAPVKESGEKVTVQKVVKLGKIERNEPMRTDVRQESRRRNKSS